jgi:hypothetical protein
VRISSKKAAVVGEHDELENTEVGRTYGTHIKFSATAKGSGAHVNQRELL